MSPRFPIRFIAPLFLLVMLWPAGFLSAEPEWFPQSHELFRPLEADPRELQYAVRLISPVSHKLLGFASIGDYLGIARWKLPWKEATAQVSVGGGVFGRFDLASKANDMQSADFYANLPLDVRISRWAVRFMMYHTSSHLGDDYLKVHGGVTEKHSWDNLRWLLAYDASSRLRLYGGCSYAFRTLPGRIGRTAVQGGAEVSGRPWTNEHFLLYWANDWQAWERVSWKPMFTSQAGLRVHPAQGNPRGMAFFIEFGAGHQAEGQFYRQKETRWGAGIKFSLS